MSGAEKRKKTKWHEDAAQKSENKNELKASWAQKFGVPRELSPAPPPCHWVRINSLLLNSFHYLFDRNCKRRRLKVKFLSTVVTCHGNINFYLGNFGGMGAPSVKHEAHERSDFNMLQT